MPGRIADAGLQPHRVIGRLRAMARVTSPDGSSWFELTPVHVSRSRGAASKVDAVVSTVSFDSFGEPVSGELSIPRDSLERMLERLKSFCDKQTGMMQLRTDTQELELSLAAKRSKWTQKLRVSGMNTEDETEPQVDEETRATLGVVFRQDTGQGGAAEHRCNMSCQFDALAEFTRNVIAELAESPRRRETGTIEAGG